MNGNNYKVQPLNVGKNTEKKSTLHLSSTKDSLTLIPYFYYILKIHIAVCWEAPVIEYDP